MEPHMRLAGARSAAPEWPSRKPSGGGPSRTRPTHSNTKSVPTTQSSLSTELDHGIDMIDVPSEHNHKLQTIRKTISKNDPLSLSGTCLKARGVHGPGIFGTLNSRPRCFIAHTISQDVTGDSKSKILARLVAKRSEHKSKITKHKLPDGRWASQDQEGGSSSSGNIQPAILSATYLGVRKDNRVAVPLGSGADSLTREQVSEVQRPLYPLDKNSAGHLASRSSIDATIKWIRETFWKCCSCEEALYMSQLYAYCHNPHCQHRQCSFCPTEIKLVRNSLYICRRHRK